MSFDYAYCYIFDVVKNYKFSFGRQDFVNVFSCEIIVKESVNNTPILSNWLVEIRSIQKARDLYGELLDLEYEACAIKSKKLRIMIKQKMGRHY